MCNLPLAIAPRPHTPLPSLYSPPPILRVCARVDPLGPRTGRVVSSVLNPRTRAGRGPRPLTGVTDRPTTYHLPSCLCVYLPPFLHSPTRIRYVHAPTYLPPAYLLNHPHLPSPHLPTYLPTDLSTALLLPLTPFSTHSYLTPFSTHSYLPYPPIHLPVVGHLQTNRLPTRPRSWSVPTPTLARLTPYPSSLSPPYLRTGVGSPSLSPPTRP